MGNVPRIFFILYDEDLPEAEMLHLLEDAIKENPDSVFSRNGEGLTPLHYAAFNSLTPAVCKMLVEADTSLRTVRATENHNFLPFHNAIVTGNLETAKYLFEVYPESISTPTIRGCYAMHLIFGSVRSGRMTFEVFTETFHFLLKHGQCVVSIADEQGMLPLHYASKRICDLPIAKHLFDAYPGAIHIRNIKGHTPLKHARNNKASETVSFFQYQLKSAVQLSLREALGDSDVSLGCIKLMIEMNPQSLREVDSQGQLPVHIACSICDVGVVKCLVEAYPDSLQRFDANGNLPLHTACGGGKLDVINYILEVSDHGVGMKGREGMLPIHLLLLCAECDRDSVEYVDSVGRLLRLNPTSLVSNLML